MPTDSMQVLERVSTAIMDTYTETDEEIGPRIGEFESSERQLNCTIDQLERMRDATIALHGSAVQLSQLQGPSTGDKVPSVHAFSERQEGLAHITQQLATQYDRFVSGSANQLKGRALIVANKYKSYCNKTLELRRRKAQLQLMLRHMECSKLRSLERAKIPATPAEFTTAMEGPLSFRSTTTRLWYDCYARLDSRRKVLLLLNRPTDPPSAATKAFALEKYVLAHEVPEAYVQRAAAFEIMPLQTELPLITLAANGSMASRKWVCALQQAMDAVEPAGQKAGEVPDPATALSPLPMPRASAEEGDSSLTSTLSTLKPLTDKLEQFMDFSYTKIDELDKRFSLTLAEQASRVEAHVAQLARDRELLGQVVVSALDEFKSELQAVMASSLLEVAQAQLDYHQSAAAQMIHVCAALRSQAAAIPSSSRQAPSSSRQAPPLATPTAVPAATPTPGAGPRESQGADGGGGGAADSIRMLASAQTAAPAAEGSEEDIIE